MTRDDKIKKTSLVISNTERNFYKASKITKEINLKMERFKNNIKKYVFLTVGQGTIHSIQSDSKK